MGRGTGPQARTSADPSSISALGPCVWHHLRPTKRKALFIGAAVGLDRSRADVAGAGPRGAGVGRRERTAGRTRAAWIAIVAGVRRTCGYSRGTEGNLWCCSGPTGHELQSAQEQRGAHGHTCIALSLTVVICRTWNAHSGHVCACASTALKFGSTSPSAHCVQYLRHAPAQVWARGAPQSRRRCGRGEPLSPGADVGGEPIQSWRGCGRVLGGCGLVPCADEADTP